MHTTLMNDRAGFSSREACELADITYRQLDYWCRVGTISSQTEAKGSGSRRRWSRQQVLVLAVLAQVGGLVRISELDELAAMLMDWDADGWDGTTLLVSRSGVWIADEDGAPAVAVAINLAGIRGQVQERARELGAPTLDA